MSLKRMCYKAGGYARRNDPSRREYYSSGSPSLGSKQPPASGQNVSPIGGCGVAIFMFGGLLALVCPPLGVIVFLVGGLMAGGSAIASSQREQSGTTAPALPIVPATVQPDEQNRRQLIALKRPPPAPVQSIEPEYSKCSCQKCGQHLEFPWHGLGMTIKCPTCGLDTVLYVVIGA